MPTCCACEPEMIYSLTTCISDAAEFVVYTTPAAVALLGWKFFVTNRKTARGNITVLRLDASSLTYSPEVDPGPSTAIIIFYLATALATFSLGLLAFAAVHNT